MLQTSLTADHAWLTQRETGQEEVVDLAGRPLEIIQLSVILKGIVHPKMKI